MEPNEIIPTPHMWLDERAAWIAKRDDLITAANGIDAVTSDDDLDLSGKVQTDLAKALKELAKERLDVTRQIDSFKKQFMEQEKVLGKPAQDALKRIKSMNDEYNTKKEMARQAALRAQQEADRKRQEEEARAQMEAQELFGEEAVAVSEPEPVAHPPPPAVKSDNNRIVKRWNFDVRDLSKVPPEYLDIRLNEKAVRAYISMCNATEKIPNVPGLNFSFTMSTESK